MVLFSMRETTRVIGMLEKIRKQALNNNRNIWTQLPTPDRPEDAEAEL